MPRSSPAGHGGRRTLLSFIGSAAWLGGFKGDTTPSFEFNAGLFEIGHYLEISLA
jgi:hypothetical protein